MKRLFKKVPIDYRISISLMIISLILLLIFKKNILYIITENKQTIVKTLYLTVIATSISTVIHFSIPSDFIERNLNQNKFIYLFYATILGILTPGPVYSIYTIVIVLKNKGIKNSLLVSYLTGQTIIGPARIPFELGYFGLKFFIYRLIISLIMGPLAGLLYIVLSRFIADEETTRHPKTI